MPADLPLKIPMLVLHAAVEAHLGFDKGPIICSLN